VKKRCTACGKLKPLEAFYRLRAGDPSRVQSRCKPCDNASHRRENKTGNVEAVRLPSGEIVLQRFPRGAS